MILLYLEASLERLVTKWKLGFQQAMIILFENISFIDTWPTSLRSNRIEHLTALQWIIFVICTNYTRSWKPSKMSVTAIFEYGPTYKRKGSKWKDSELKNVFYYTAHSWREHWDTHKNHHPPKKLNPGQEPYQKSFTLVLLDGAAAWRVGNPEQGTAANLLISRQCSSWRFTEIHQNLWAEVDMPLACTGSAKARKLKLEAGAETLPHCLKSPSLVTVSASQKGKTVSLGNLHPR